MNKYYDVKTDFYLDKIKKPIATCIMKEGKPFNGTVVGYYENKKNYYYKTYKEGERIKKARSLSKKQLIKVLN